MPESPPASDVSAFYSAALASLRFIEERRPTGRRFGVDADARWKAFRGDLNTADRVDLMIRDANAQWPRAFGASVVFSTRAVAEDEAFGAYWEPMDPVEAEELWRSTCARKPPESAAAALEAVAAAWGFELTQHDAPKFAAADKLVVAGPSAIAATMEVFESDADLDWSDQVTIVATSPGHRQLAALAGGLLGVQKPARLLSSSAPGKPIAAAVLVISGDASSDDAQRAKEIARS